MHGILEHKTKQLVTKHLRRINVWLYVVCAILLIFNGVPTNTFAQNCDVQRKRSDSEAFNCVKSLISKRRMLARSVFPKQKAPEAPKKFVLDYNKTFKTLSGPLGDNTWTREIVNIREPGLRYGGQKKNVKFTALESTTLLVKEGRVLLYIADEKNVAVGLLFDTDFCEMHGWLYSYWGDVQSSSWVNSDKIPFDLPDPQNPTLLNGRTNLDWEPSKRHVIVQAKLMLNKRKPLEDLLLKGRPIYDGFYLYNEILVGLSKKAISGVFVQVTTRKTSSKYSAELAEAQLLAISRRQVVREMLGVTVPLIQLPHCDNLKAIKHISVSEQQKFLSELLESDTQKLDAARYKSLVALKMKLDKELKK